MKSRDRQSNAALTEKSNEDDSSSVGSSAKVLKTDFSTNLNHVNASKL